MMKIDNIELNPILLPTWRWLGVNEPQVATAIPAAAPYDRDPRQRQDDCIRPLADMPPAAAALAAKARGDEQDKSSAIWPGQGYFIEIPAADKRTEPILLSYDFSLGQNIFDEQFILAHRDCEATVVLLYQGDGTSHQNKITVYAEKGAKLHLVKVQLLDEPAVHIGNMNVYVEDEAVVELSLAEVGASESITGLKMNLSGSGSKGNVQAIYFGDQQRKFDMNYVLRHEGRQSEGSLLVHGALLDQSEKIFRGTLDFIKGAKGAAGRELEEVVLLSSEVRNRSVPLMLSGEDAVDGHHAVSVGKMNEEKLFYLMSRGLSRRDAEKMVIEASFAPLLARIPVEYIRERIEEYIRRRLAHVE